MQARDVMVAPVITAPTGMSVQELAQLLLKHRISAVPVVDMQGAVVGLVSEGDLLRRVEAGTERRPSWLSFFGGQEGLAQQYVKSHACKVADVMTRDVVTASPETPLQDIATLLERNSIKRVPIVENGQLVGIVSRANLIQAVASAGKKLEIPLDDTAIRDNLMKRLREQPWGHGFQINAIVNGGVVDLWGIAGSAAVKTAVRVAAENTAGVRAVNDHLITRIRGMGV